MRCPKCGYTSFDNLEHCKRCKKNIAATATALMGTVFDAVPPPYLQGLDFEADPEALTASAENLAIAEGNDDLDLDGGTSDTDLGLPESPAAPSEAPAADMDLNLSDVDISDLKDPDAESPAPAAPVENFSLENLQLDDLGINKPAPPPTPAAPASATQGTKTGTALDDFNVELDELLTETTEKA